MTDKRKAVIIATASGEQSVFVPDGASAETLAAIVAFTKHIVTLEPSAQVNAVVAAITALMIGQEMPVVDAMFSTVRAGLVSYEKWKSSRGSS